VDERRAAWREFAQRVGVRLLLVNLDRPDQAEARTALALALQE
jgi:predicted kinase